MESVTRLQIQGKAVHVSFRLSNLRKGMNPLFPPVWRNSKTDYVLYFLLGNQSGRRKTLNSNKLYPELELTLSHILVVTEELIKYTLLSSHQKI